MMQPPELLQDLCVVGVPVENPSVSCFRGIILNIKCQQESVISISNHIRPCAVHGRDQSGTRCPPQSTAWVDFGQYT